MKIAVAGTGYVGLSLAVLLSRYHDVIAVDLIEEKVEKINKKISPIKDEYIEKYLKEKKLKLTATTDGKKAYRDADFVIIATPTNYDSNKNFFDCSAVESVIEMVLSVNKNAMMVIKSTIPVGYTENVRKRYNTKNILFHQNFLENQRLFTTIFIQVELLCLVMMKVEMQLKLLLVY